MGSSVTELIDALCIYKIAGETFEDAWKQAWAVAPVRMKDIGGMRGGQASLDDLEDDPLDWLKAKCHDAYVDAPSIVDGKPSRMRHIRDLNLPDMGGTPARRATAYSRAA